jgi:hypothetical protein
LKLGNTMVLWVKKKSPIPAPQLVLVVQIKR